MKVEQRRELRRQLKKAEPVFKRIKKRNNNTKLTSVCIARLMSNYPELDVEGFIDSNEDYYYNNKILEEINGGRY